MGGFDYVAVPWPDDAPDPQPEMRAGLEAMGFRLLGGCSLTGHGLEQVDAMAAAYGPEHREEFAARGRQPGQVFAAPDGTAYVQLAWLWACRYGMFTSVLADGSLVQTCTSWDADPRWPTSLAKHYAGTTDRRTEQLVLATDPDATVVEGDVQRVWAAHQDRLAAVPGTFPDHTSLPDFVDVYAAESRNRAAWARRIRVLAFLSAFAITFVPYLLITVALGDQPWWVDGGVVLTAGLATISLYLPLWLRLRTWRRLRPHFLAPVPATRATRP